MKTTLFALGVVFFSALTGCRTYEHAASFNGVKISDIDNELINLMETWFPKIVDTIHGGYWTNFGYDWSLSTQQDKGLITQARGLWAASRAATVFSGNPVYRKAADHGYRFLVQHMWDTKQGGFFQNYYSGSSQPADSSYKLTYGNAFALFALAEYATINKSPEVLDWVKKSFYWLENAAHDPVNGGYFNIIVSKAFANNQDVVNKANWGSLDWKDQNTSIHLMEAFSSAYRVLPEQLLKKRLAETLELVRDTMVDQAGYLRLFFTRDWNPVSYRDSSRAYILKNINIDHISFGHDIETAYLMVDASQALYGKPDSTTLSVAEKLVDHTLMYGFDRDYYGLYYKGYVFSSNTQIEIVDSTKTWWAQAEAWHALALFSKLYPQKRVYQQAFKNMWGYIKNEMIDYRYGGWYNKGLDMNPQSMTAQKASQWKCCYHDGRALFQVLRYAKKEKACWKDWTK